MINHRIKFLILFNFLSLWLINSILAMETPKDQDLEMKLVSLSLSGQHHTVAINDTAYEFTQEIKVRGQTCLDHIRRGNNAQTNEKKTHYYGWALTCSNSLFECCKFYSQRGGYQCSDNGLGVFTLLDVSNRLVRGWTQKIDLKSLTPSLSTQFYTTLLSLIEIDFFVCKNSIDLVLFSDLNPSRGIDPDAAHYKLLSHLATLFIHFNDKIEPQQRDIYLSYAYDSFEKMTSEYWMIGAKKQLGIINGKQKQYTSTKVAHDMSAELLTKASREADPTYMPTRTYNPTNDFLNSIKIKDEFFAALKVTKDKSIYGKLEENAHLAILAIEAKISKKLNIVKQPNERNLKDYEKIYKELSSFFLPEMVNEHLQGFIIILQNYGDHEGGEFRRTAIANIVDPIQKAREKRRQTLGLNDLHSVNEGKQQAKEELNFHLSPTRKAPQKCPSSQIFWKSTSSLTPTPFERYSKENVTIKSTITAPANIAQDELKPEIREEKKQTTPEPKFSMLAELPNNTSGQPWK